jgi:hypothetical protein
MSEEEDFRIEIGRGLFANRFFAEGELLTVAPVLVLNKTWVDEVSASSNSLLQNYCLWDGEAEIVLLPISTAIMMNHAPTRSDSEETVKEEQQEEEQEEEQGVGPQAKANTEMRWFSWRKAETFQEAEDRVFMHFNNASLLLESTLAPLDLGIYATRDIEQDEELFLDYGVEWEELWRQTIQQCSPDSTVVCEAIGKFRSYVYVPPGLFPSEWSRKA